MTSPAALKGRLIESQYNEDFMAFAEDAATRETLMAFAKAQGWPETAVVEGGQAAILQMLTRFSAPRILVADLSKAVDPANAAIRILEESKNAPALVALGETNDVQLFRSLLEAGATDYLVKPISTDALNRAMAHIHAARSGKAAEPQGLRVITFIGARGGVGATTLAINTAWLLSHEFGARVALMDMDLRYGTVALNLDIDPGPGLREAMENPDRIDSLFLSSVMARLDETLSVLATEEALEEKLRPDPIAFVRLMEEMRESRDYIVVDMPRHAIAGFAHPLTEAHTIVVVSDLSLPGVRDSMRLINMLRGMAPDAKLRIALNRAGTKNEQISREEFERGIEKKIDFAIPEDAKAAGDAANAGKAMASLSPKTAIVDALRQMTADISGRGTKSTAGFSLGSLLPGLLDLGKDLPGYLNSLREKAATKPAKAPSSGKKKKG